MSRLVLTERGRAAVWCARFLTALFVGLALAAAVDHLI